MRKPFTLSVISLAVAALAVFPTAGRPVAPRLSTLERGEKAKQYTWTGPQQPTEPSFGNTGSQLVWFADNVTYEGYDGISLDMRKDLQESFSIESNTWVIRVKDGKVNISWQPSPDTTVIVTQGDQSPVSDNHSANTY